MEQRKLTDRDLKLLRAYVTPAVAVLNAKRDLFNMREGDMHAFEWELAEAQEMLTKPDLKDDVRRRCEEIVLGYSARPRDILVAGRTHVEEVNTAASRMAALQAGTTTDEERAQLAPGAGGKRPTEKVDHFIERMIANIVTHGRVKDANNAHQVVYSVASLRAEDEEDEIKVVDATLGIAKAEYDMFQTVLGPRQKDLYGKGKKYVLPDRHWFKLSFESNDDLLLPAATTLAGLLTRAGIPVQTRKWLKNDVQPILEDVENGMADAEGNLVPNQTAYTAFRELRTKAKKLALPSHLSNMAAATVHHVQLPILAQGVGRVPALLCDLEHGIMESGSRVLGHIYITNVYVPTLLVIQQRRYRSVLFNPWALGNVTNINYNPLNFYPVNISLPHYNEDSKPTDMDTSVFTMWDVTWSAPAKTATMRAVQALSHAVRMQDVDAWAPEYTTMDNFYSAVQHWYSNARIDAKSAQAATFSMQGNQLDVTYPANAGAKGNEVVNGVRAMMPADYAATLKLLGLRALKLDLMGYDEYVRDVAAPLGVRALFVDPKDETKYSQNIEQQRKVLAGTSVLRTDKSVLVVTFEEANIDPRERRTQLAIFAAFLVDMAHSYGRPIHVRASSKAMASLIKSDISNGNNLDFRWAHDEAGVGAWARFHALADGSLLYIPRTNTPEIKTPTFATSFPREGEEGTRVVPPSDDINGLTTLYNELIPDVRPERRPVIEDDIYQVDKIIADAAAAAARAVPAPVPARFVEEEEDEREEKEPRAVPGEEESGPVDEPVVYAPQPDYEVPQGMEEEVEGFDEAAAQEPQGLMNQARVRKARLRTASRSYEASVDVTRQGDTNAWKEEARKHVRRLKSASDQEKKALLDEINNISSNIAEQLTDENLTADDAEIWAATVTYRRKVDARIAAMERLDARKKLEAKIRAERNMSSDEEVAEEDVQAAIEEKKARSRAQGRARRERAKKARKRQQRFDEDDEESSSSSSDKEPIDVEGGGDSDGDDDDDRFPPPPPARNRGAAPRLPAALRPVATSVIDLAEEEEREEKEKKEREEKKKKMRQVIDLAEEEEEEEEEESKKTKKKERKEKKADLTKGKELDMATDEFWYDLAARLESFNAAEIAKDADGFTTWRNIYQRVRALAPTDLRAIWDEDIMRTEDGSHNRLNTYRDILRDVVEWEIHNVRKVELTKGRFSSGQLRHMGERKKWIQAYRTYMHNKNDATLRVLVGAYMFILEKKLRDLKRHAKDAAVRADLEVQLGKLRADRDRSSDTPEFKALAESVLTDAKKRFQREAYIAARLDAVARDLGQETGGMKRHRPDERDADEEEKEKEKLPTWPPSPKKAKTQAAQPPQKKEEQEKEKLPTWPPSPKKAKTQAVQPPQKKVAQEKRHRSPPPPLPSERQQRAVSQWRPDMVPLPAQQRPTKNEWGFSPAKCLPDDALLHPGLEAMYEDRLAAIVASTDIRDTSEITSTSKLQAAFDEVKQALEDDTDLTLDDKITFMEQFVTSFNELIVRGASQSPEMLFEMQAVYVRQMIARINLHQIAGEPLLYPDGDSMVLRAPPRPETEEKAPVEDAMDLSARATFAALARLPPSTPMQCAYCTMQPRALADFCVTTPVGARGARLLCRHCRDHDHRSARK